MLPIWGGEGADEVGFGWRDGIVRACPRIVKSVHRLDSRFSSLLQKMLERYLDCPFQLEHTTRLSFLIFLVATACWIRPEEDGDGEWAEVNIGAAIGAFPF